MPGARGRTHAPSPFAAKVPPLARSVRNLLTDLAAQVAEGEPAALQELQQIAAQVRADFAAVVRRMRERGYTWAQLGEGMGLSRQSAQERFGRYK